MDGDSGDPAEVFARLVMDCTKNLGLSILRVAALLG